ncbi:hypothetical protein [Allorhizocola rhizosphaerae]|uniref:hypothetical protein n=1 Tax=Allorhizocola rhizosphaerae TaxID=1872709 RepID=UPI000E3DED42|nr:hypothetical protein [Allorhizocola rhizosphaerae]
METSSPHPEGGSNAITSQNKPTAPGIPEPEANPPEPPLTFAEAVKRSPYSLLTELHEQALHNYRETAPEPFLAELALSSAVIRWWTSWQPIAMERAFEAGAGLDEVAAAMGSTKEQVLERWSDWAGEQSQLIIGGRPAVDPDVLDTIRARLADQL